MTFTNSPRRVVPAPVRPADAQAPARLSHLALVTRDAAATTDFYSTVMRMELVAAVMHERVPSTGDTMPYLHIFFRMQDGSTVAFFEVPDLPAAAAPSHPAHDVFRHIALEVPTTDMVDEWREWVRGHGVDVLGPVDHTIIYSIYFHDPDGNRLEITTPLVADWNDRPIQARRALEAWTATKERARRDGTEVSAALHELVVTSEPTTFD
ncbi:MULTISPECIES: VOC family protein [Frankia]|uniref:Glyoxalase/Bleomycin resistance protein/dioxygenase domain n=1 Tax=Frankia alni (strain DSM 45986 / CECT 9034 / ACN14a) TaxID=326424 RepID=Q0RF35_FRAAA|nr:MULTISPECIES: VOC family protein [Frankia]CAJ63916.1 putative Glyoxalase/Bleomycin resistance protein/dioxygenase domain [Frankia alni ACN14a]